MPPACFLDAISYGTNIIGGCPCSITSCDANIINPSDFAKELPNFFAFFNKFVCYNGLIEECPYIKIGFAECARHFEGYGGFVVGEMGKNKFLFKLFE